MSEPRPPLLGPRACLAFGACGPVERVGPSGQPLDPLLVRTDLEPGLHLGLPRVGTVGGEPIPYAGVGLLLDGHLLDDGQPLRKLFGILYGPVERLLCPRRGSGGPLGLPGGAPGLPGEPPELLGHGRLLPVGGPPPLPDLLDERGTLLAPLHGELLRPGQLLAPHGQFIELRGGFIDGGLHFQQTRRPGGPTVREVGAQQIPFGGHGGQLRPRVHQFLGVFEGLHDNDPTQQPPYGGHEFEGASTRSAARRGAARPLLRATSRSPGAVPLPGAAPAPGRPSASAA